LAIRGGQIDTNIVICEIDPAWAAADQLVTMLGDHGVRCFAISASAIRFVTHLDVNEEQIGKACEVIKTVACRPLAKSV
jgi:threonine aldolase